MAMAELKDGVRTFHAKSRKDWRDWLFVNHQTERSVWLIIYKKTSQTPSVYYDEAVNEALCFGWIDSKPRKRDNDSYYQFFSKRNPKSNWSKVNKNKVAGLIKDGLMTPAGLEMIALAKKTGTWSALDPVDEIFIPNDLSLALSDNPVASQNWDKFARSSRRGILEWIASAKRSETRQKRILQTVSLAEQNIKANHPAKKQNNTRTKKAHINPGTLPEA